ncbi:S-layer homology domain-containing protein [Geomicrobium sp. JCM 19055]|uniref:S-layer homology domain-containing protein n=1 Tax=Geomicrobium sp. JCM 19055 TaxID=1460649 RepID=UPI00045ED115|nr:S-layer homology domain-containing protein [Geomicrobium sp. JCM 19055]GAJ97355.1 hypothetical protein JCM19055_207 [Geomicrobium sp. JCM 19055]
MAYQPKSYRKFIAGTMTAAMAASAFAVTTPQQVADAQEQRFSDVPSHNFFYEYVQRGYERELIQGYPDGTYRPSRDVNRGQIATMITRALKLEVPEPTETPFLDLQPGELYADVATAVSNAGIILVVITEQSLMVTLHLLVKRWLQYSFAHLT